MEPPDPHLGQGLAELKQDQKGLIHSLYSQFSNNLNNNLKDKVGLEFISGFRDLNFHLVFIVNNIKMF